MDGILLVNKPKGVTTNSIVYRLRHLLGIKKIGHTGTLDPEVDGLIVVAIGQATKLITFLQSNPKTYIGEATLGFSTDTQDLTGQVIKQRKLMEPISNKVIDESIESMIGVSLQTPPKYSAVKVKGKRLYEYARFGEEVNIPSREIEIFDFNRVADSFFNEKNGTQSFAFKVTVSKGTYIRTIVTDFGDKLDIPAVMSSLTRISADGYELTDSNSLEDIEKKISQDKLKNEIISIDNILSTYPEYNLSNEEWSKVKNGAKVKTISQANKIRMYFNNQLQALYVLEEDDIYKPEYMFLSN